MTPEELDEARATKAYIAYAGGTFGNGHTLATIAARIAREEEQERARVLVEPAEAIVNRAVRGTGPNDLRWPHILKAARRLEQGLTAYKAGKEAGK
jgi:hypothetical protein